MDRCALFVDASYVLTDGALAVHGTRNRDSVSWDYAGMLKLLSGMSRDRTGVPVLRCYWYDSSPGGDRTADHDKLADLPAVKLRLSKTRPSRKEGVEAEIRRDLTALARNRAVSDVVIVSGDEDLGTVITEVQDLGVRATLLHVAIDGGEPVSRALRQECDDTVEISAVHLRPFVDLIHGAEPAANDDQVAAADYRRPAVSFGEPVPAGYRDPAAGFADPAAAGYRDSAVGAHVGGYSDRPGDGDQPRQTVGMPAQMYPSPVPPELRRAAHPQVPGGGASGPGRDDFGPNGVAGDAAAREPSGHLSGSSRGQDGFAEPANRPRRASANAAQNGLPGAGAVPGELAPADNLPANGSGPGAPANGPGQAGMPGDARPAAGPGQDQAASNGMPAGPSGHNASAQPLAGEPLGGAHVPQIQPGPAPLGQHHLPQQQPDLGMAQSGREARSHGMHQATGPGSARRSADLESVNPQQVNPQQGGLSQSGSRSNGSPQNGLPPGGLPQQVNPQQGGLSQGGPRASGSPQNGLPPGGLPQNGMHYSGQPQNGLPPGGLPQQGAGQPGGLAQNGLPPGGLPQQGAAQPGGLPQNGMHYSGLPQNGQPQNGLPPSDLPPMDAQRPIPAQRQLPPGNGVHYPPDRAGLYGGQAAAAQQYDPARGSPGYYGAPPAPALPPAISVAEAVQSAHAEGYGFGEAVARDAPALWLEAVLARKPRMPSDLEARLLQGSALPIDSLLHDEVRHALRRGFWDALERSRH